MLYSRCLVGSVTTVREKKTRLVTSMGRTPRRSLPGDSRAGADPWSAPARESPELSYHCVAAADAEHLAGDVAGEVGGEEEYRAGQVLGRPQLAHRVEPDLAGVVLRLTSW